MYPYALTGEPGSCLLPQNGFSRLLRNVIRLSSDTGFQLLPALCSPDTINYWLSFNAIIKLF